MNKTNPVEVHNHRWIKNNADKTAWCDQKYNGYPCKAIKVSSDQYSEIEKEWNNYFELIKSTEASRDFYVMGEAWKKHNLALVKDIHDKVLARNKIVKNGFGDDVLEPTYEILTKPDYPDPRSSKSVYVVEVAR